jgi:hypothetical protein
MAVLTGNLAQLSLVDILKLLSSGRQAGRLDLTAGPNSGEIYLQGGAIVHAVSGVQVGEEAIYTLMGWLEGDFNFVAGPAPPEQSVTIPTEQLLRPARSVCSRKSGRCWPR